MSFDYDTIRGKKHSSGTQWAAYSDLFMVLAFIFLLMYMVSSLRAGMASVTTYAQIEEVKKEIELYESVKDQYLKEDSSEQEKIVYQQILNKISLLEDEASNNKNRLAKEYHDQKVREESLNQYQKLIVSMMNANAIAKAEASQRMMSEQDRSRSLQREVEQQKSDLLALSGRLEMEAAEVSALKDQHSQQTRDLERKFSALKNKHDEGQDNIASLKDMLKMEAEEKSALKDAHSQENKALQRKYHDLKELHDEGRERLVRLKDEIREGEAEIEELKYAHSREKRNLKDKLADLAGKNDKSQQDLASMERRLKLESQEMDALKNMHSSEKEGLKEMLESVQNRHNKSQRDLASLQDKLDATAGQNKDLERSYAQKTRNLEREINDLKGRDGDNRQKIAALEGDLRRNESEKDDLKNAYSDVTKALEGKLKNLKGEHAKSQKKLAALYDDNRDQIARLNSDLDDAKRSLKDTSEDLDKAKGDLAETSKDLDRALQMEQRRKDIAKRIKDNFRNNGIVAHVNSDTGDVILDFGDNYFDTDSHKLKPGMKQTVRKAIPVYAQSLFGSDMLASLISSVEIIGFASPTYGGKPVDPTELSVDSRVAVNYNLDLSYKRARSIFEYVFDTQKIKFKYQDTMVHLINVTGRSYFSEEINPEDTGGLTIDEFCGQYNCMKSQRVIIKFGLSDKGTT